MGETAAPHFSWVNSSELRSIVAKYPPYAWGGVERCNDMVNGAWVIRGHHGNGSHTLPYTPIRVLSMYGSLDMNLKVNRSLLNTIVACFQSYFRVTSGPPAGPAPPVFPVSSWLCAGSWCLGSRCRGRRSGWRWCWSCWPRLWPSPPGTAPTPSDRQGYRHWEDQVSVVTAPQ